MPWFKVDDKFHSHPKVMELSTGAVGLWALAGAWCADYLTDGEIRRGQIRRLGGNESEAEELVGSGLWLATEAGYSFRDWHDYQPTREAVEAEREASRERQRKRREDQEKKKRDKQGVTASSQRDKRVTPTGVQEKFLAPVPDPVPGTSKEVPHASDDAQTAFNAWWPHYPKKVDKGQALKAFKGALNKTSLEELSKAATEYAQECKREKVERKFIKNPATWLNAEAWDNEPDTTTPGTTNSLWEPGNNDRYLHPDER